MFWQGSMIPDLAVLRTGVLLSLMFGMRAAIACDLPAGEVATVAAVEDGETFRLRDGRRRLAGRGRSHGRSSRRRKTGWRSVSRMARRSSFGSTSARKIGTAISWRRSMSWNTKSERSCKARSSRTARSWPMSCQACPPARAIFSRGKVKPAMRGGVSGGPGHIACRTQLM